MKVVQIIKSLKDGGGAEKIVQTLATSFSTLGHISIIVLLTDQKHKELEGVQYIYSTSKGLTSTLKMLNADIVLAHMKTPQRILKKIYMENLFFVIHSTQSQRIKQRRFFRKGLYGYRVRRLQKLFDGHKLVTVSKGVADDLIENIKVVPESLNTIYNPFNINEVVEQSNEPLSVDKPFIIHAGRLEQIKRQDILLRAYAKSDIQENLVILGGGSQLESLKQLANKLKISSKVHFLGWKENPYPYIKNAQLFVLSSEIEGLPTVLIESLILHTPVISTNCKSGPSEILIDSLKTYLCEVNNVDMLAQKIKQALVHKPKILPRYYLRFDAIKIAKQYLALR